jgi:hypothetical protein
MSLPTLPETTWVDVPHFTFTCEAMRAYGQQCAEAERERCAQIVEQHNPGLRMNRADIAAAIRSTK